MLGATRQRSRRRTLSWATSLAILSSFPSLSSLPLLGCSSAKPPDAAVATSTAGPTDSAEPAAEGTGDAPEAAAPKTKPASAQGKDDSVPDDYQITESDCNALGQQFGNVTRSDLLAMIPPKITGKAREKAEADIERESAKKGDQFGDGCRKNVGKNVDPRALKCAMNAPSAKAFDVCMNGPELPKADKRGRARAPDDDSSK
jgi:hypothetical protein